MPRSARDDQRTQFSSGIGQGLAALGSAAVGGAIGGSQRSRTAFGNAAASTLDQQRQLALQMEQQREQQRLQSVQLVQKLAQTNPQMFASMPPEIQQPFIDAIAEPIAEVAREDMSNPNIQQAAKAFLTQPPPGLTPGQALQGAASFKDVPDVANQFLEMVSPEITARIGAAAPEELDPFKVAGLLGEFTAGSIVKFAGPGGKGGSHDPRDLVPKPPTGENLEEFTNRLANEGYDKMMAAARQGANPMEAINSMHQLSIMKKLGMDDRTISPNGIMAAYMAGMGSGLPGIMEQSKEGFTPDAFFDALGKGMQEAKTSMEASGLLTYGDDAFKQMAVEFATTKVQLETPDGRKAIAQKINARLMRENPDMGPEERKQKVREEMQRMGQQLGTEQ